MSDREASTAFNAEHARLQEKTAAFLDELMGRMVVTFATSEVSYSMPDFETTIDGETFDMAGYEETHPFIVVATTPDSIAISTTEPVSHEPVIVVYHMVSNDRMWIYVNHPEIHVREYFKRM